MPKANTRVYGDTFDDWEGRRKVKQSTFAQSPRAVNSLRSHDMSNASECHFRQRIDVE